MNLKHFLRKLPKDGWYFEGRVIPNKSGGFSRASSAIRRKSPEEWRRLESDDGDCVGIFECCPVTSICDAPHCVEDYELAASRMNLDDHIADVIADAADGENRKGKTHPENHAELRRRLLDHCGLQEVGT